MAMEIMMAMEITMLADITMTVEITMLTEITVPKEITKPIEITIPIKLDTMTIKNIKKVFFQFLLPLKMIGWSFRTLFICWVH